MIKWHFALFMNERNNKNKNEMRERGLAFEWNGMNGLRNLGYRSIKCIRHVDDNILCFSNLFYICVTISFHSFSRYESDIKSF